MIAERGVANSFAITAIDPSGVGCWLGAPLAERGKLREEDRTLWSRVSAHIAAGHRLRRKLATASSDAVFTPSGKAVHLENEAAGARTALRDATLAVERARGKLRKKPNEAVGQWRGLVSARWSLIDSFESDGKRYVVA